MQLVFIHREPVKMGLMLSKRLSVIGAHKNRCIVPLFVCSQRIQNHPDMMIRKSYLMIVSILAFTPPPTVKPGMVNVPFVRIEKMDPKEPRLVGGPPSCFTVH